MDVVLEKKLSGYKQIALEKLDNILLTIFGRKDLVVEPEIIRILDSFANMTWLKSKGFDKVYKLSSSLPPKTKTLVYMIFANLVTFKHVLDQISLLKSSSSSENDGIKEFHIIVVPSLFFVFRNLVESEGLAGIVSLHGFSWDFIKIDRNLLLLEIPSTFQQVFIQKDKSLLSSIAKSLRVFTMVHKRPNMILTCGENSEKVIDMLTQLKKPSNDENPDFNVMVVIDRDVDYPSCLLTPVTYSGLMLELFDMKAGILNIEGDNKIVDGKIDILKEESKNLESHDDIKTLRMCGTSDELYTANKYKHFAEVVNLIKAESKNLEQEKRKYSRDMNLEQMKDFVEQNLPKVAAQKKILYKHLIICEKIVQEMSLNFEKLQNVEEMILRNENRKQIISFIDENMSTNAHKFNVLRLMALFHIFNGYSGDETNRLIHNYLNAFGQKNLYIFHNLFKAKLFPDILRPNTKNLMTIASNLTKKTQFMTDAIKFKLIPINESEIPDKKKSTSTKTCPSYVFNDNYIPFIAQVAHNLLQAQNFQDISTKFANFDMKILKNGENSIKSLKSIQNLNSFPLKPKSIFIFVIGGITYAEVAACKMIESLTGSTIVLASDEVTNGINLVKSAF
ncbi:vacuolar protein sorting-associated protein 33B [Chironomus tepperi]|uniref:vacuolar protein sorting-associated protein 33B n=1 Tax=Chironomus tepperi TaxID=113505 RepID=UPI00391F17D4